MQKTKKGKGKKGGKGKRRGGASWQLSGVLKKEQKLFSSTLRFSDFQNSPGLARGQQACLVCPEADEKERKNWSFSRKWK